MHTRTCDVDVLAGEFVRVRLLADFIPGANHIFAFALADPRASALLVAIFGKKSF